jgi:tetratricopeptide (TPR) repeat protein
MRRAGGLLVVLLAALSLVLNPYLYSQNNSGDETRKKAFELFRQDKQLEALPLFEELALKSPDDRDVLLGLGACLVAQAASLEDQDASTRERVRARQVLLKARKLGQNSELLENLLQMIPEDGVMKYANTPADQAMKAAEAAFSQRDFDAAIENYSQVLKYDPKNYEAVLFIGDTYFAKKDWQQAAVWYQKAIDMDPNRETAHRYYGDMLMKNGDMANSRTRFMQAVVAEPYNPVTWRGLKAWADTNKLQLKRVHIEVPKNVVDKDNKNITITVDPKDPEQAAATWVIYGLMKASWHDEEFKKQFPQEKQYRHSLPEEADALSAAAAALTAGKDSDKKKSASSLPKDPNLLMLLKLKQANLIEPYVLLNGADEGIAQDYAGYREKNREKLVEYLSEFVVPPAP